MTGTMAAMRMVPLLEYYVTDSMYHQLQCISDVSMERFCPRGIIVSFHFDQIQKLVWWEELVFFPPLHYFSGCISSNGDKEITKGYTTECTNCYSLLLIILS